MKDLEDRLSENRGPSPTRELTTNFTQTIVSELKVHPRPLTTFQRFKENLTMKLHRPAAILAAVGITLAFGGTAYATDGFKEMPSFLNVLFGTEQTLPNGDRIVSLQTKGCHGIQWSPNGGDASENGTYYYRITKGSSLTNTKVAEMIQGHCELEESENMVSTQEIVAANPANKDTTIAGSAYDVITAITPSSLSTHTKLPVGHEAKDYSLTYSHIDPAVIVYDYSSRRPIAWSKLKVGDHVVLRYRASGSALANSEVGTFGSLNTNEVAIVHAIRIPATVAALGDYIVHYGKDLIQVSPCKSSSDGWCDYASSPAESPSTNNTNEASSSTPKASKIVESAYQTYLAQFQKDIPNPSDSQDTWLQARNTFMESTTTQLAAEIRSTTAYDRIFCGQNIPESVTFAPGRQDGNLWTVPVTINWTNDVSSSVTVAVDTRVNKISTIVCPAPQ